MVMVYTISGNVNEFLQLFTNHKNRKFYKNLFQENKRHFLPFVYCMAVAFIGWNM
jgi:hypothetical protein